MKPAAGFTGFASAANPYTMLMVLRGEKAADTDSTWTGQQLAGCYVGGLELISQWQAEACPNIGCMSSLHACKLCTYNRLHVSLAWPLLGIIINMTSSACVLVGKGPSVPHDFQNHRSWTSLLWT